MTADSYDHAPYSLRAHTITHPRNLAAAARLLGFSPQDIHQCRVLDLGCAQGGNIIPMAETLPGSEFVGIDYSPRQIEDGREIISSLGLGNITLQCEDIASLNDLSGRFHYIIVHGVYSWVPDLVRQKIMTLCRKHLAENGIAYISFNTYPGWFQQRMLREIMQIHVKNMAQRKGRAGEDMVADAREILSFLTQVVPAANNPYGMSLRQMAGNLAGLEDAYILHEYLEDTNQPVYFSDFLRHVREHGLDYVGDAQYLMRDFSMLPPAVGQKLKSYCGDELCLEQYLDFMRNESFRRGLVCREGLVHRRQVDYEVMESLFFTALSQPVELPQEKRYENALGLKNAHGTVIVETNAQAVGALRHLCEISPRAASFEELWKVSTANRAVQGAGLAESRRLLAARLVQAVMAGMVEAATETVPFAGEMPRRPKVPAFARWQSRHGPEVTSLRHENIGLDDFARRLLPLLDGSRDYDTLLQEMAAVAQGLDKAALRKRLTGALQFLSRAALLSAQ